MTLFLRLLDVPVEEKALVLRNAAQNGGERIFDVAPGTFVKVPGSPLAYWAPPKTLLAFSRLKAFHSDGRAVVSTNPLNADFRYVRLWWEVLTEETPRWRPWVKGGSFSRFYYDPDTVIVWDKTRSSYFGFLGTENRPLERPASVQHFFRPGLTWPRRTNGLSFRVMPAGCIFADKGPAAFITGDAPPDILALCAMMNSRPFGYLVSVQLARTELAQSYEVGLIQQTPIPEIAPAECKTLAQLARRAWALKRTVDTVNETSHAFLLPSKLRGRIGPFDLPTIEGELAEVQRTIDDLAFRGYELNGDERSIIKDWALKAARGTNQGSEESIEEGDRGGGGDDEAGDAISADTTAELYSWAVGVSFGRFDLRLATGKRAVPPDPEPFDPLPLRSPGMVPEADAAQFSTNAMFVDDPGHKDDLTGRVVSVLEHIGYPEPPDTLRQWLAREFFPLHIKMYSKSRRKAPIYWQLATSSASYSVWLYLHAFTRDTLYTVQNYVELKVAHEERNLDRLRSELGAAPKTAERKKLVAQESFIEELRALFDEVRRVAPLWNPNLDDGVIINFAPLWRLVPHHKPWQKELKATWDALCAGEYDWAHLAMHLWPERVVPKCAEDRSLAIAHGLEEVFWTEVSEGKWKPRPAPTRPLAELIQERKSPAVEAALKSLLEAPVATGATGRGRGRRAATKGGNP